MARVLAPAAGWCMFLGLWHVWCEIGRVHPIFLPPPTAVLRELVGAIGSGELTTAFLYTAFRTSFGFSIGAAIGIAIGVMFALVPSLYSASAGVLDFMRSIPVVVLFPLFILAFGIHDSSKVVAVIWTTVPILIINTAYGAAGSTPSRREWLRLAGVRGVSLVRKCLLWEALPSIVSGLRVAFSAALVTSIVTEMLYGAGIGLGRFIYDASSVFAISKMYAGVAAAGAFGLASNTLFQRLEERLRWA